MLVLDAKFLRRVPVDDLEIFDLRVAKLGERVVPQLDVPLTGQLEEHCRVRIDHLYVGTLSSLRSVIALAIHDRASAGCAGGRTYR